MIFRSFAKRSQGSLSISLITRFPCLFRRKYPSENAGKGISECLGFKIFWGSMPPDPCPFSAHLPRRLLLQYSLLLKNLLKALLELKIKKKKLD